MQLVKLDWTFNREGGNNLSKNFNDKNKSEFEERVVTVNRVAKVAKGGRSFRFAAIVVVGDRNGRVGFGIGKHQEVPEAIKKAIDNAKKSLVVVPIVGTTIPHEINGRLRSGHTQTNSAKAGTGLIPGGLVSPILPLADAGHIFMQSLRSNPPYNMICAPFTGLDNLKTAEH